MSPSESYSAFTSNMIGGRPCPKCQSPMIIAHSVPAKLGFDLRTFECVRCGNLEKETVDRLTLAKREPDREATPHPAQPPSEQDYGGGDFVSLNEEPSTDDDRPL